MYIRYRFYIWNTKEGFRKIITDQGAAGTFTAFIGGHYKVTFKDLILRVLSMIKTVPVTFFILYMKNEKMSEKNLIIQIQFREPENFGIGRRHKS